MQKVYMLKGLPGSGKSNWVLGSLCPTGNVVLSDSDIAKALSGSVDNRSIKHTKSLVKQIEAIKKVRLQDALCAGYNVIVEGPHLEPDWADKYKTWAKEGMLDVEVMTVDSFLDVPLVELVSRNKQRGKDGWDEDYIIDSYNEYVRGRHFVLQDPGKPKAVVFDVDGTLAERQRDVRGPFDWEHAHTDRLNLYIASLYELFYRAGYNIVVVSSREATKELKKLTEDWLADNAVFYHALYMRPEKDNRPDWQVKEDLLKEVLQDYFVEHWVDDRFQVVTHIRSLGINVLQCKDGRY